MKNLFLSVLFLTFAFGGFARSAQAENIEGAMFRAASFNPASVQVTNLIRYDDGTNAAEVELSFDYTSNDCGGVQFIGFVQNYEAGGKGVKAFIPLESPLTGGCAHDIGSQKVKQKIIVGTHPENGTKIIKIGSHSYRFNGTSVELLP